MDYRWVDDKDPIIGTLQTLIQQTYGECNHQALTEIAYRSGISVGALRGWFFGETKLPRHASVRMVLQALDCRVKIIRNDGTEIRARNSETYKKETDHDHKEKAKAKTTNGHRAAPSAS